MWHSKNKEERLKPGPKFTITFDMAVANVRRVAERLGITVISGPVYMKNGSFCLRTIERRHGWRKVVEAAGLSFPKPGRPARPRKPCIQGCGRLNYWRYQHCRTCFRRIGRNA